MKQGLVRLLYNFGKRFMGWTLHTIMCVLLCYPVFIHMSQLLSTGHPISSCFHPWCPDGQAGDGEKICPGCISETVRCSKLILGRDTG